MMTRLPVVNSIPSPSGPLSYSFRSRVGEHLLIVPHTRIFDVPPALASRLEENADDAIELIASLAESMGGEVTLDAVVAPSPQSLSLNVSSTCNMGCSYCYASQGAFNGAQAGAMTWDVARAAMDKLLDVADPTAPITIGFFGGEPFVASRLIHQAVHYAANQAEIRRLDVRFALTTNGTMLSANDLELLRSHAFAVTVSIDGGRVIHNRQRPLLSGKSSFAQLIDRVGPLLARPGRARIAARVTVRRDCMELLRRFDEIAACGFDEIGFAPLRVSAGEDVALREEDWANYLTECANLARRELAGAQEGKPIRFSNFVIALKQIHRGWSSPYPCGAGGGYFSVSSGGAWYACHRAIGNPSYELGTNAGLDEARRAEFVRERHVHAQTSCHDCWARYLCSGGCHQESSTRSQASCDFIRGWLAFCLQSYCELIDAEPQWFSSTPSKGDLS